MKQQPTFRGPVNGVVGLVYVFIKLFLLPAMMAVEVFLLIFVFVIGVIRPRLGLILNEWFCNYLPDRDWYWERSMRVRSWKPNPERSLAAAGDKSP